MLKTIKKLFLNIFKIEYIPFFNICKTYQISVHSKIISMNNTMHRCTLLEILHWRNLEFKNEFKKFLSFKSALRLYCNL